MCIEINGVSAEDGSAFFSDVEPQRGPILRIRCFES